MKYYIEKKHKELNAVFGLPSVFLKKEITDGIRTTKLTKIGIIIHVEQGEKNGYK